MHAAQMESVRSQGQYKAQLTAKKRIRFRDKLLTSQYKLYRTTYTHLQIRHRKTRDLKTIS